MSAALVHRQLRLYRHLCKVYRASRSATASTGLVSDDTWAVVSGLSSVPCHFRYTQNDSDQMGLGRLKRRSLLTEDHLKVAFDVAIRDQDLIVDVTPADENGIANPNYGTVYRAMGQPRVRPTFGGRKTNERTFQIFQEEKPPSGVTV